MLELRGLSLRYGAQSVLRDVDLRLRPGERLGLIGPSGAGKSSLLRLAAGLARPSAGVLRNDFRHAVLMFQEPRLLPWRHALDNVALPLATRPPGRGRWRRNGWAGWAWMRRCSRGPASCRAAWRSAWPWPAPWRRDPTC